MRVLGSRLIFPPPEEADEDGLLAIGGDLSPERLLLAYAQGIFPWPSPNLPLLWFSPDPRCVLEFEHVHVGRSLQKMVRRGTYRVTFDTAFGDVMRACATRERPGQHGTWITAEMVTAYVRLHELGFAHSAEAWLGDRLVGGVYGVALGSAFFGESMFATEPDASKVAFVTLLGRLATRGTTLVDCQMRTDHLARFGATEIPRTEFLSRVRNAVREPRPEGPWTAPANPTETLDALRYRAQKPS
ncbi:MAG: leucyl/phenylalanyl-tRNA--protein transferase [Polyangiales bacterium]